MIDFLTRRPIAHRGLHDGNVARYENSLSAFEASVDGDYAIELDVQLSADGVAMVFHDDTLDRLTAETGPVADRNAEELRQIRLGPTSDGIPSLADTLAFVDGRVPVVIEVKDNGARNATLAKAVAADLAGYDGPAAVMSFEHDILAAFRDTGSRAPLGLTAEGIGRPALARHKEALALDVSFVSYHVKALPNPFVTHVRDDLRLPVITWTVRTPEDVETTRRYADQMTFEGFDPG
ncbi:glycerophosphodiester phosphodiesterase family protein [Oricola sp.]|uniref:glycerophosphodiester phosphodiesterase family protein n=1 Tax=Oricola sp. TaxID=1979950 RepID=UPI0025E68AEA|nr:glycerophosphodiester phosphodiesterase family protein [Oricola sp.]MCI5076995.1 glycerophosphodiester phosphodiesterase [Oricola sp.]